MLRLRRDGSSGPAWPSLVAFLRLVTNPRSPGRSRSSPGGQVTDWLATKAAWIPAPSERHAEVLGPLVTGAKARANLIPDVHLAALPIEHGLTLCSTDGDLARFPGLPGGTH